MQIGPSCYTVAPARSISVSGPVFPWQNEYEIAKQEEDNSPGISQLIRTSARVGERLFTMEPFNHLSWMELDIQPLASIFFGGAAESVNVDQVAGAVPLLKKWTRAKVRVYYQITSGEIRTFDADIGTGVILTVPPCNKVEVDVLIPREQGIQEIIDNGSAPPIQGPALRDLRFATTISCKCTCVGSPGASRARYTELHFVDSTNAGPTSAVVKLQRYADNVQVLASPAAGSPALLVGDIRARYATALVESGPDILAALFPFFDIPFVTPSTTEQLDVPRPYANVVRVSAVPTAPPGKQANVVVSQELAV